MRELPASFIEQKNAIYNANPWYILIQLQATAGGEGFYLTNSNQPVTSNSDTYDPYPITFDNLVSNSEGELFELDIIISNVTRQLMSYIESEDGLVEKVLKLEFINSANPNDSYSETLQVVQCSVSDTEIKLKCSYFYINNARFPGALVTRDYCRWEFGSDECGVDITNVAIYNPPTDSTCNKKVSGTYGCDFWGDREVAAGDPRAHPQRYGAFPSVPRGLVFEV